MDIHQLRVFLAVYGKRSFSRASESLQLSQPTISDHIKNLERELGFPLFDRLGRSIVPTAEAEALVPKAAELVEKLDAIPGSLRPGDAALSGSLSIGSSTIPGTYWLPSRMAAFRDRHPGVRFEIRIGDSGDILQRVESHDLLIGVIGARLNSPQIESRPVAEDELVLAAPPGFGLPDSMPVSELRGMPFVLREEGSGTRRVTEVHLAEHGFEMTALNVVAILGSTEAVKQAIIEGLGASIISRQAVAAEAVAGKLLIVPLQGLNITRTFHLIRHRKRTLPRLHEAVYEFLALAD